MQTCRWLQRVEAGFDGETPASTAVEKHLQECAVCTQHLETLQRVRGGVQARTQSTPTISDTQFPHFMQGIRTNIERPARRPMGLWAALSLTTAALLVALAAFSMFYGGPEKVRATEIESASTELQGASVDWYDTKEGVTTVWVNVAKEDIE
jgi:anti-sigma factor RsiW